MLRHQRLHTSPVYPPCASCVGTFWRCVVSARRRRRRLGVIPVSFASPVSFILSVCTLLIFPTQKNSPSSITGWSPSLPSEEDEKSQQAVKPKSNSSEESISLPKSNPGVSTSLNRKLHHFAGRKKYPGSD